MRKKSKSFDGIVYSGPSAKGAPFGRRRGPFHVKVKAVTAINNQPRKAEASFTVSHNALAPQPKASGGKTPALRIIPFGGQEEVGRNMTVFEYEKDIVILDMGMQFPEEDMPGIDYIIPNINYLKGRERQIKGVIFSHGHLDHIGAAPILLEKLSYPPIIGRDLTLALVKRKTEDYKKDSTRLLRTIPIKSVSDKIRLGKFEIGFFEVEHSIMDAIGTVIKTPAGTIIHPGDWTMGKDPVDGKTITYNHLANLPSPRILMLESLGATDVRPAAASEKEMYRNLEQIIYTAIGKVIIGTFSSQIKRIGHLIEFAEQIGKKVALDGYSMKMNIEIAKELGYIKAHKQTMIPVSEIHNYPENKILIICTGAQGEGNAVLSRIITDNHKYIKIRKSDTVIFSSSVIPGNERTVQRLKDNLYRKCDNVIHNDIMDVHTSGHCNAEDIKEIARQIKPDYFLPVYGNHFMLKESAKLAMESGIPKERIIVMDNGSVVEFQNKRGRTLDKKIDASYVFVDGLGIGDIGQVVLRDRQLLSADGMFVITVLIDNKTKGVIGNPQVTSRGFIYVKENFDLVNETKRKVIKVIKDSTSKKTSVDKKFIEDNIRDVVGQFLFSKTERRPMILPVVIEV